MLTLFQALGVEPTLGPWFGLNANVANAPWSALLSLVMIMGVARLGSWCIAFLRLDEDNSVDRRVWPHVAPVVGAGFLMIVCYPMALLGVFPREVARGAALGLLVLGCWQAVDWLRRCVGNKFILQWRIAATQEPPAPRGVTALFTLLLGGLGLLALAPVTDADSLDYHVGVALAVLNSGAFPAAPEWFHSRLAGSGEVLIALGFSIGAEQFGALLQFLGVVAVMGILRHGMRVDNHLSAWAVLVFLSCPVLVAWTASPKPLLLPIAMTTIAVYLAVHFLGRDATTCPRPTQLLNCYILICLLVMVAATTKLNFLLSGGLAGLLALFFMWRQGRGWSAIGWGLILSVLVLLPPVIWKHAQFGGTLWEPLLNPFPGDWPGTESFRSYLVGYRDSTIPFPLLLVVPDGLGTVTTILGVGLAALFLLPRMVRDPGPCRTVVIVSLLLVFTASLVGQKASRFYLEPMIWLLMASLMWASTRAHNLSVWWTLLLRGQALLTLTMIAVGVGTLSVGAFSVQWRDEVMSRRAYGYQAMKWVDEVAPAGSRVISGIHSIGLLPRYPISDDWRAHAAGKAEVLIFYEELISRHAPDHLLVLTAEDQNPEALGYTFQVVAGPADVTTATRNPFNSGAKVKVWLLRLEGPKQ